MAVCNFFTAELSTMSGIDEIRMLNLFARGHLRKTVSISYFKKRVEGLSNLQGSV